MLEEKQQNASQKSTSICTENIHKESNNKKLNITKFIERTRDQNSKRNPKIEPTNKHNPKQAQEHKQCFLSE